MLSRRMIVFAFTLFLLMSQSACVESVNPIADPKSCTFDDDLIGLWKFNNKGEVGYLFIDRARGIEDRPDGLMVIQDVAINKERELELGETPTYFFPVKVGEYRYCEIVFPSRSRKLTKWDQADKKSYTFVKYETTDGKLKFWLMDKDAAKKAVEDNLVKGTIENKLLGPVVTLTEATEGLRRFFAANQSDSLFTDKTKLTFARVK